MIKERELAYLIFFETVSIEEVDYPLGFDKGKFKSLDHKQKLKYLKPFLARLGGGSARIVFSLDSQTVLKIAKNEKGIAQNNIEIDIYRSFSPDIVAKVYDYDEENSIWLEMERAEKLRAADFKSFTGISFKDFGAILHFWYRNHIGKQTWYEKPALYDKFIETDFFNSLVELMGNYDMPAGDIIRPSSWGIVQRNGSRRPVLIDFGLTLDVWNQYYNEE